MADIDIDIDAPGEVAFLMGNEAIARGALEAGIGFAASYPGTPSSEILPTIAEVAKKRGIYAEWSVNEMVAMEAAAGASLAGIRALTSMKQNGVHVITDFLGNIVMTGTVAGLVLVAVDDPSGRNSSNEQDTRPVARWLGIPLLEPGDFQEAKDMTRWLFDLSEELKTICMLRSVSKISHTRGNVLLGDMPIREMKAYYDLERIARLANPIGHQELLEKLARAKEIFELSSFNHYTGPENPELMIITCGSGWLYSREAVKILQLERRVGILKIGTLFPLPENFIEKYLTRAPKVLFVEEIDPFLEPGVKELAADLPPDSKRPVFYGKRSGHLKAYGEQEPDTVIEALASILCIDYQPGDAAYEVEADKAAENHLIPRSGTLCPGCPHKASFWVIKEALKLDNRYGFVTGDIGCYTSGLGAGGFYVVKTVHCMGGGAGIANGMGQLGRFGFSQPVIAACGDSTFYHAAIPALINGVFNKSNFVMAVLDNSATSMTGFQPHPGTGYTAMGDTTDVVKIEDICRGLGIRVEICDPFDIDDTVSKLLELMDFEPIPRVVVMRHECELIRARREEVPYMVHVNPERCIGQDCGCDRLCTRIFACTGLRWNSETGKAEIDEVVCSGCGFCADICPQGAIVKEAVRL